MEVFLVEVMGMAVNVGHACRSWMTGAKKELREVQVVKN